MSRKARIEGATTKAPESDKMVAEAVAFNFAAAVEAVKADKDFWEAHRLCPLQHGLDAMIDKLKG